MRRKEREMPAEFGWQVADKCDYAVLAMTDTAGMPYAVPLSIARDGEKIYFHAAGQGEKTQNLRANPHVCVVCVADVNPLPQEFSTEYASAIIRGQAAEVTDEAEKIMALRLICQRYAAANMAEFEGAISRSLHRTAIWRVDAASITAKRKKNDKFGREMRFGRMDDGEPPETEA